jgi:LPS sulfotransferase NodH
MSGKEIITGLRSASVSSIESLLLRPYLDLFGTTVKERFVVLGNARTGSNYLLDGLASSSSIQTYHEIFASHNREIGQDFDKIFSMLFRKERRGVRLVGFKLFYNHLTPEEWQRFLEHREFKVIHLLRRNRLRTIISLDIAFKTRQWTRSANARPMRPEDRMVSLDPAKLIERIETIRDNESLARQRLSGWPVLELVYEDMVAEPLATFERIGAFLGVDDIDPSKIRIRRQNPEKLDRLVTNYADVRDALAGTPYAEYLNE